MASDTDTLTFSITVETDTAPAFAAGASVSAQNYLVGTMITPLTLPAATGGNGDITYALSPPGGLIFDPATRILTGAPTTAAAATMFSYTASDSDANKASSDRALLTFDITVETDTAPAFAAGASVPVQNYLVDTMITPLTLPAATGGNGAITYALTPAIPGGLTFDPATRVLTGAPTTAAPAAAIFEYTARDSDANTGAGDRALLPIGFTVRTPATGFDLMVMNQASGSVLSTVTEGVTQGVKVSARPTPDGSAFAADQQITFTVTPPLSSRPASAADPYVGYTAVAPGTMPLAVGAAAAEYVFSMATTEDAFDHADFPVTITVTASPSGATGTATVTLLDNDISITTTAASATVAAAATATYDVQLSEAPPTATTVTVASQGTATATVSPATLTFTTTNWNTALPVTVTGVAVGSTTIRHTAPTVGGVTFVTNNVAVTVTAPVVVAPVFTNAAAFAAGFDVEENQSAVRRSPITSAPPTPPPAIWC